MSISTRVGMPQFDDLAADVVTVHEREVAVEDDHVVVVDADAFQGGRTVVHDVDGHGLPAQPGGHRIGEQLLVLDDEYAHVACPSSWPPDGGRWAHAGRGLVGVLASILPFSAVSRR
ncbi:hypothetical protein SGLAM104S_06488 [Streptomyces glaucescens]